MTPEERLRDLLKSAPDCGDNSCRFVFERKGQRTNGGCRCHENEKALARWAAALRSAVKDLLAEEGP